MNHAYRFLLIVYVLFSHAANAVEDELNYDLSGSSNWIPYYMDDSDHPGIIGELIPLILLEAGIKGNQITLPPTRTNLALEHGLLDFDTVSPSWLSEEQLSKNFVFSEPLIEVQEYIVYLPNTFVKTPSHAIIEKQEVGTVRGYYYHDDLQFKRIDFSSEKELVYALNSKRVRYAIIGDLPAKYWSSQLGLPISIGPIHSKGYLHIRLRKEMEYLLVQINEAIRRIKLDGRFNHIIDKYLTTTDERTQ